MITIETAPTIEPVTYAEAKEFLRITHDDETKLINSLIAQARASVEFNTESALLTQTRKLWLDGFPCSGEPILIKCPPISAVSSIEYLDSAGALQTWSSSLYQVDTKSRPARVRPNPDQSWPTARSVMNAVRVTFVAGVASADLLPAAAKTATLLRLQLLYDQNRLGTNVEEPPAIKTLEAQLSWGSY